MAFNTNTVNTITVLASSIAIIVFIYSIFAYFINNRRKCNNNKRKIKYIPVNFNRNYLDSLKKHGVEYSKVEEADLPNILQQFDNNVELFEELSGVYKSLEEYSELKSEIEFYEKLEKTTLITTFIAFIILGLTLSC